MSSPHRVFRRVLDHPDERSTLGTLRQSAQLLRDSAFRMTTREESHMTERQGKTIEGKPGRSEKSELRDKGRDEKGLKERSGQPDDGSSNHPVTKKTGVKAESNVGEDLTSGAEGIEDPTDPTSRRY
jgi:hypothetical protein